MFLNENVKKLMGIDQMPPETQREIEFIFNRAVVTQGDERNKNITRLFQLLGADRLEKSVQDDLRDKVITILDKPEREATEKLTTDMFKWNSFAKPLEETTEKVKLSDYKWTDPSGCKREPMKPEPIIERANLGPKTLLLDPYNRVIKSTYASINVNDKLTNEGLTSLKRRGVQIKHIEG